MKPRCFARWTIPLVALLATACPETRAAEPRQRSVRLSVQVPIELNYLLYLPPDYESRESWPLLLFLHGAGERGNDLNLVKKHGPPKLIDEGKDFPLIVVSPQCPRNRSWEPTELIALLDDLARTHKVDTDRIYVTGLSMGGFGTWALASYVPDRLAAIAPICGGGEKQWARRYARLPIWAFHGAKDEAVPLARSQEMIDALKQAGGEPRLTIYPEAGHDSWTETYNNPEFYAWLLAQRRGATPIPPPGFEVLFNGRDLSGWHGLNPHNVDKLQGDAREAALKQQRDEFARHWRVENGELVNDGTGPYATTDKSYGNIELRIEYKTVPMADSGIYLRGTPQVQIWDINQPSRPDNPDRNPNKGSGGLFNNTPKSPGRDPLVVADKPFGQWNSFRIRQVGAKTWVWLNDQLVVDGAVMENFWDRSKPLAAQGPIMLQTHGGEIRWRNIFIRELPDEEAK